MCCPKKVIYALLTILITSLLVGAEVGTVVAQSATGVVTGRVRDKATGEALVGASVGVTSLALGTATDLDGGYRLVLPVGRHTIEVRLVGYQPMRFDQVEIRPGQETTLSATLSEGTLEQQEVEVVGKSLQGSEDLLIMDQRSSTAVQSGVTAELLRRTPDRTAGESLRRISGTSIKDGRFAVVRGLNERYNLGQVNGVQLPSTEPDRKAFALDLFPSALVDRIIVSKTATPDQPGDFAGGLVRVNTLDIPARNQATVTAGLEVNSITTGRLLERDRPSSTDFLGFDDGSRALPRGMMSLFESRNLPDRSVLARQSQAFRHDYVPERHRPAPNVYLQGFMARRGSLAGREIGGLLGVNYFATSTYTDFSQFNLLSDTASRQGRVFVEYDSTGQRRLRQTYTLSAVGNVAIRPDARSKLSTKNMLVVTGSNQSNISEGKSRTNSGADNINQRGWIYYYEQSRLSTHQIGYERALSTQGARYEVLGGATLLSRQTPDYRRLLYVRGQGESQSRINLAPVGDIFSPFASGKFFSTLNEQSYQGSGSVSLPFRLGVAHTFKVGGLVQTREREFQGRNFLYGFGREAGPEAGARLEEILSLGPDSIFRPEHFAPGLLLLRETTQESDFYSAGTRLWAGFAMLETTLGPNSRLIYGVRAERYLQRVTSARGNNPQASRQTIVTDFLPSVNLNLSLTEQLVLRAATSRTVNRPELRELSPFQFFDPNLNASIFGNDTLRRARVDNYDLKLEFYPTPGQTISVNAFYKEFSDPIEQFRTLASSFPTFSYLNAYQARARGLEIEYRIALTPLAGEGTRARDILSQTSLFGNLALIRSRVRQFREDFGDDRPLQAQSPYVLNAGISYSPLQDGWEGTVTVNRVGPAIVFVQGNGGIWSNPRTIVDVTVGYKRGPLTLRLIGGDLLAQPLIQFTPYDRGGRQPDDRGLHRLLAGRSAPRYQAGQDIVSFSYTYGWTARLQATYTF